jgi:hypothetical protein
MEAGTGAGETEDDREEGEFGPVLMPSVDELPSSLDEDRLLPSSRSLRALYEPTVSL